MRKLFLIITVAILPVIVAVGGPREKVVPKGKTYVQLDAHNKEIARFKGGQSTGFSQDCVQVACPSTFPQGTICWTCRERPIAQ